MKIWEIVKRYRFIVKQSYILNKKLFFMQLFQCILNCCLVAVNILLPKLIIQQIMRKNFINIIFVICMVFLFNIIWAVIDLKAVPYINSKNEEMNIKIVNSFLLKSYSLKLEYFDNGSAYNKYNIVFDNCCDIFHNAKNIFFQFISSFVQIFFVLSILYWIDFRIILLIFFIVFLNIIISKKKKSISYIYNKDIVEQNRQLNYIYRLFYVPQFIRDLKVNSLGKFIFNKKDEFSNILVNKTISNCQKLGKINFCSSLLKAGENLIVTCYLVFECISEKIWVDDFFVAFNGYNSLKNSIESLLLIYTNIYENDLYVKDYIEFMNTRLTEDNSFQKKFRYEDFESIEFQSVYFKYPNQNFYALNNVSFKIYKGDKLAIIGINGAGKSTIIKLLLRLYDVESGKILINGININEYDLFSIRNAIAVLFQDYSVYPFTLRENISFGDEISDEIIYNILETVNLHELIKDRNDFLDLPITNQLYDGGVELSGGESQRIAIARVIAANKKFFILDEPTSNLDKIVEKQILKSMIESNESTVILVTHNLSFTSAVSRVICFYNGEVVGDGTHIDLLRENVYYQKLYNCVVENE